MSKTVDEKVVQMRFDNQQFESGVKTSMSTLDKLKQALRLDGASKGLENVASSARDLDLSPISNGVETVKAKFSAMEVIAITALANITNSAMNTGKQLVSSLTVDQIAAGWNKYEQKTASVQTLINSTGLSIDEVNGYLDKLMWFSDETSYSFSEMTSALAQMTSSGGDIQKLMPMITGIANATAFAGKGSAEFQSTIRNLAQSYQAGYLQLQDMKSLNLMGTSSKQLKETFISIAESLGKIKKGEVTLENFDNSLSEKWADTEVMEKALGKFSELSEAAYEAVQAGQYDTAAEAIEALSKDYDDLSVRAFKSAQEAKSFTEAIEATKDAVSSGWLETFEIIFGNYEESKVLWTDLANAMWEAFASGAEARNEMLQGWKDLGGRDDIIQSFWNIWNGFAAVLKPIKNAWNQVFPPMTAERLKKITGSIKDLTEKFKISGATAGRLRETFHGLFSLLDLARKILVGVGKGFASLLGSDGMKSFSTMILNATAAMGRFFSSLNKGFDEGGFNGVMSAIGSGIGNVVKVITDKLTGVGKLLPSIGGIFSKVFSGIGTVFTKIKENFSFGDIFAGLAGGGIFAASMKFIDLIKTIKATIEDFFGKKTEGIKEKVSGILDSVHESLESFTSGIKIASLLGIAIAVSLLASSLKKIGELNAVDIGQGLGAIAALMAMLNESLKSISKTLKKYDTKGLIKAGIALVLMAAAIRILAGALEKIGKLSLKEIAKGLFGVGGGLAELCAGLKIIDGVKVSLSTAISILAVAKACQWLGDAMQKFAGLSWDEIGRGLTAMGGALAELVAAISVLGKTGGFKSLLGSVGILIVIQGLDKLANALDKFGAMAWDEIKRGLVAMGGALTEVTAACTIAGKIAGFSGIFGAGSILIVIQGLDDLVEALKKFGDMSWDEIKRGLTGMGGALAEVATACTAAGKIAGFSGIFGAGSILIVIQGLDDLANALIKFGDMAWDEIGRGLTAMGGALGEVSLFSGALGKIAGFSGIFGAGTILTTIQGLDDLANALAKFGEMTWDEIGRGLTAMGGALGEVSLFSGALGMISGFSGIFGAGTILITIQGLDDLASALSKFGEMSWEEIARGLTAMGGALLEVSLFSGALGIIAGFAGILGGTAIYISIQGLNDLADALKSFGEMSWDEIERGLTAMGAALLEIAVGGIANSLSGLGAMAISEVAKPLGDLAESVKKWAGITVPPDLGYQLQVLADGIFSFTFSGWGASAIAEVAAPLGTLAESVTKWTGVVVPDGIGDQLQSLSEGVKAFTWAFVGGYSISVIAGPLGDLGDSVKKWVGVYLPSSLKDGLTQLADGVKAFTWAFVGGWSLDAIVGPLGDLADSVKKWYGVSVPKNLKEDLTNLADGVKAFSWAFVGTWTIGSLIEPLGNLADAVKKWNGVRISDDVTQRLKDFADIIVTFANDIKSVADVNSAGIDGFASSVQTLNKSVSGIANIDTNRINTLTTAIQRLGSVKMDASSIVTSTSNITTSIRNMMNNISSTISSSQSKISSSMKVAMNGMTSAIKSSSGQINSAATGVVTSFANTIKSKTSHVNSAFRTLVSGAANAIKGNQSSFINSGSYLAEGLVIGIKAKEQAAYNAGLALGQKAVQGEKDGQKSKSPSRATMQAGNWLGEGLIIGMKQIGNKVYASGKSMGSKAVDSVSGAFKNVSDVINGSVEVAPAIRPVVDMSNVAGANFAFSSGISASIAKPVDSWSQQLIKAQADINDSNKEVISAIKGLREDLGVLLSSNDQEIALYVDSNRLTSALVNPMNRQLNLVSRREGGL